VARLCAMLHGLSDGEVLKRFARQSFPVLLQEDILTDASNPARVPSRDAPGSRALPFRQGSPVVQACGLTSGFAVSPRAGDDASHRLSASRTYYSMRKGGFWEGR